MNIQIDELMRLHARLVSIKSNYENNFNLMGKELFEIEQIIRSSSLTASVSKVILDTNNTAKKLEDSLGQLAFFLRTQMSRYRVTNEEALKSLNELIAVLNGGLNVGILNGSSASGVSANQPTGRTEAIKDPNADGPGSATYDSSLLPTEGKTVVLPSREMGGMWTNENWQGITAKSSNQYKLREAYGMNFDEQGIGVIDGRWVVATTTTYGNVGDALTIELTDGRKFGAIIGDIKSQGDAGCNMYGHNNGHCVVEFLTDRNAHWGSDKNFFTCYPEYKGARVASVTNTGHYDF